MRRNDFLKTLGTGLTAIPLASRCTAGAPRRSADGRPNIVLIMADDMGFSDPGCYGGEAATPHIDSLARDGVRFTRFYNAARCCPTRAGLLTGLYPHQAGMGSMVTPWNEPNPEPGPYQGFLRDDTVTLAEALGGVGYRTYMSGKWHVGWQKDYWPCRRGFDRFYGFPNWGGEYFNLSKTFNSLNPLVLNDRELELPDGDFYLTDAISDHAVSWLDEHEREHADKPFFLYLAPAAPHWPLQAPEEDINRYRGMFLDGWDNLRIRRYERMRQLGLLDSSWPLSPRDPDVPAWDTVRGKVYQDRLMAVYSAMIDRMDQGIGRVLRKLNSMGAEENTLIVFLSDNGASHEIRDDSYWPANEPGTMPGEPGSYVTYEKPWANYCNTPFRKFKRYTHEGGIATPLIVRWLDKTGRKGRIDHRTVGHIVDLMPTFLDAAGADYPRRYNGRDIQPSEGTSLLRVFRDEQALAPRTLFWEHEGSRAVLHRDRWKLVAAKDEPWSLYDLEKDRTELNDLSNDMPDMVRELGGLYSAWAERVGVRES